MSFQIFILQQNVWSHTVWGCSYSSINLLVSTLIYFSYIDLANCTNHASLCSFNILSFHPSFHNPQHKLVNLLELTMPCLQLFGSQLSNREKKCSVLNGKQILLFIELEICNIDLSLNQVLGSQPVHRENSRYLLQAPIFKRIVSSASG